MFGSDEVDYLRELDEEHRARFPEKYETRTTGLRAEHTDGVVRDKQTGKTKYTLMFPKGVPMADQLIVRVAELYTRGGENYGDRNWENSSAEDTLEHHTEALWRHFMNFFFDVQDGEDHAAAIVWNVNAVDLTRRRIAEAVMPTPAAGILLCRRTDIPREYIFPLPDPEVPGRYQEHPVTAPTITEAMQEFEAYCVKGLCSHADEVTDGTE